MEMTEKINKFNVPKRELLWRRLTAVGKRPVRLQIPLGILIFLVDNDMRPEVSEF